MSMPAYVVAALNQVESAVKDGRLSPPALQGLRRWLMQPEYEEFVPAIIDDIADENWETLNEVFCATLPFGTAGRRGRMYPVGTNVINERTIGETIQGLADFLREEHGSTVRLRCAVAYDTRHNSRLFAELTAEVFAAANFTVWFLDGPRPTPELAYTVRQKDCHCGVMVSASHNPPSDNAVKVFWDNGGQILPFEADGVMSAAAMVTEIRRELFDTAVQTGDIVLCQDEMDGAYIGAVLRSRVEGPRDLRVLFTPLHGVGASSILPVLNADGFSNVELYEPHADQNADFPNVPNNIANPEAPEVFVEPMQHAMSSGFDVVLATDPDADRLGVAARLCPEGELATLSGNQIAVLLAEFLLRHLHADDELTPEHFLVKTLVTTDMLKRIADRYGIRTMGDVLTGFKWIGDVIDSEGPDKFVFAAEEAHGYLAGTHIRDKDGAVAAMHMAELAAELKAEGLTLHQQLDRLYTEYGCNQERMVSISMPGADGIKHRQQIMARLRKSPPVEVGDMTVRRIRDYDARRQWKIGQPPTPLDGPQGDLLIFDLEKPGNYAAVRPSGTEPKIKFYLFTHEPPSTEPLSEIKQRLTDRLARMAVDLPDRYA